MSKFVQASRLKLRYETKTGLLSVENLWDLSLNKLATIIRSLKKQLKKDNDDELSFLDDTSTPVDSVLQLKFDVAKEVYTTLKAEKEEESFRIQEKLNDQKILELIAKKEAEELESKGVDELRSMLSTNK